MVVSFLALVQGLLVGALVVLEMDPLAANVEELGPDQLGSGPRCAWCPALGCLGLTTFERNGNVQHRDCAIAVPTLSGGKSSNGMKRT